MKRNEKNMKEKKIFDGKIFTLVRADVDIHGKTCIRDIIRHPGGVGMLVVKDDKILLVKQYRPAINKDTLEIPAGKLEYNEDPKTCGIRELNEETGYESDDVSLVQSFVSTPGFCDERIWIFEANNVRKAKHRLDMDDDEYIDEIWMPLEEAYQKVCTSEIDDAKTVIAIQHALLKKKV